MPKLLLRCENCFQYSMMKISKNQKTEDSSSLPKDNKTNYVSHSVCSSCGGDMKTPHPPRFSMDNRYAGYLRKMKEISLQSLKNPEKK